MNRWLSRPWVAEPITYALATAGAAAAWAASLPLAFLIGPMVILSVLAQRLAFLRVSKPAYGLSLVAIGLALGQFFTPDVLSTWRHIGPALLLTAAMSLLGLAMGYILLTKAFGHNAATASFAGLPGGILTVLEVAQQSDARTEDVLFFQVFRIVLGASTIPLVYALAGFDVPREGMQAQMQVHVANLHDTLWLVCGGGGLTMLGRKLRFPSAEISIPMVWSAGLYGAHVVSMSIPMWIPALGFIVVGASIGTLLPRPGPKRLLVLSLQTVTLFALFCGLTLLSTWIAMHWLFIRFPVGFLAFSPASLTEMIAVAIALELDPALVAANNMFRMIFCSLLAPLLLLWLKRSARSFATSRSQVTQAY